MMNLPVLMMIALLTTSCDAVRELLPKDEKSQKSKSKSSDKSERDDEEDEKEKPSAKDICAKIEKRGLGVRCVKETPGGIGSAAIAKYGFELAATTSPDARGQVLQFRSVADYDATVRAFDGAAVLAGPHRYGNREALIFVQVNKAFDQGSGMESLIEAL